MSNQNNESLNKLAVAELERFQSNREQGRSPGLWLTLYVDLGEEPDETAKKFLSVIESLLIVSKEANSSLDTWPTSEQWKRRLPLWLLTIYQDMSLKGSEWNYDAWLDSIKNRVWWWWSYRKTDGTLVIELQLDSWPYSVWALEQLALVSGGKLLFIEE